MLIRQGTSRTDATDRRLACTLAAVAGALNTAAFYAVGFFSANMTGNVSSLSDHAARGDWLTGVFYLLIVAVFVLGASSSTLLINAGRRRQVQSIYAVTILIEGVLLIVLGCIEWWIPSLQKGPVLILGLSFLMGLQNAVVTQISNARVRTTHVSGMSTDIGIELSMLFDIARGKEEPSEAMQYKSRLRLHTQTVLSFLAGGVVGVLLYQVIGDRLLFVTGAVLMSISALAIVRAKNTLTRLGQLSR